MDASRAPHVPCLAVPLGDPNGIGPEIALAAALDPALRALSRIVLVGDRSVVDGCAARLGRLDELRRLEREAALAIEAVETGVRAQPGVVAADAGRATVAYAKHAIELVRKGMADAVVAGPHNETAVARAGIAFSGYPGLLAEATGTPADEVFLMLVSPLLKIVHVTLHVGLRAALDSITPARVAAAARAADRALRLFGIANPRIGVCGINPHAGEGGLFGIEDDTIVRPGVVAAAREGIAVDGPAGADVLLAEGRHDAYLAMYHDQGHIPIKLQGRGNSFGVSIGAPVLLSTVAHGSAHDIAGKGVADATALKNTIRQLAEVLRKKAPARGSDHADRS
jgi:4-hydroxythreonine-4-phosphate dehydrogenase/1,2-dihydroxy-3,5-cyclohexadiene-1,4-dicarboxylate dehydrogenase